MGADGVVNPITTGLIRTQSAEVAHRGDGGKAVTPVIPMGRMAIPEDVATTCSFLASSLSGYVTALTSRCTAEVRCRLGTS